MSDPRNVAHDKKVQQEKAHHEPASEKAPKHTETDNSPQADSAPGELEKSQAVLSKLKEMEFHSRGNIETLAALTLTIEDELKQKEFSAPITELYSAQDAFHTSIAKVIESYEAKCSSLQPAS